MTRTAQPFGLEEIARCSALIVCSDEGLTFETSAKHHIPQATDIPYQPC